MCAGSERLRDCLSPLVFSRPRALRSHSPGAGHTLRSAGPPTAHAGGRGLVPEPHLPLPAASSRSREYVCCAGPRQHVVGSLHTGQVAAPRYTAHLYNARGGVRGLYNACREEYGLPPCLIRRTNITILGCDRLIIDVTCEHDSAL